MVQTISTLNKYIYMCVYMCMYIKKNCNNNNGKETK